MRLIQAGIRWSKVSVMVLLMGVFLILGVLLRIYRYSSYPFGFDQVQILSNSEKILMGDLTLIGPRTGYAQMFTGPLIYYIHSIFLFVVGNEYSLVWMSISISIVTGLSLFMLGRKYLGSHRSMIIYGLWALSPFIVQMDRVPWNPNLTILAASLAFFPLLSTTIGWTELLLIFLGSYLGYQAHFSGLALPVLIIAAGSINRKWKDRIKMSIFSLAGLILSLIPLVWFDMRNGWLNLNGLLGFANRDNLGFGLSSILVQTLKSVLVTIENIGKVVGLHTNTALIYLLGMVVLGFLINLYLRNKLEQREWVVTTIWLVLLCIVFGIYRGPKPEYYYLIQMPAILVGLSLLISKLSRKNLVLFFGLFSIYSISLTYFIYKDQKDLGIGNLLKVANYTKGLTVNEGFGRVVYDMKLGDEDGFVYLLSDIELDNVGKSIHIAYPGGVRYDSNQSFGGVSVWIDPRDNINHITEDGYIITFNPSVKIYKEFGSGLGFGENFSLVVFVDDIRLGRVYVLSDKNAPIEYPEFVELCEGDKFHCSANWLSIEYHGNEGYIFNKREYIFYYIPQGSENNDIQDLTILQKLSFY